jgi:hypothetical protein
MRWHLPEPLRWLAPVHGGERIHEICAARDSYAGDKHAARIRFMPQFILCLNDGRPFALPQRYREGGQQEFLDEMHSLVELGQSLEQAFARAAATNGIERAQALAEGLDLLNGDMLIMNFADELQQLIDLDVDGVLSWSVDARRMLHRREVRIGAMAVIDVVQPDLMSLTPARSRQLLRPLTERFAEQPEVLQFIAKFQAQADLGTAMREDQFERIRKDLAAARALAPNSDMASGFDQVLEMVDEMSKR